MKLNEIDIEAEVTIKESYSDGTEIEVTGIQEFVDYPMMMVKIIISDDEKIRLGRSTNHIMVSLEAYERALDPAN